MSDEKNKQEITLITPNTVNDMVSGGTVKYKTKDRGTLSVSLKFVTKGNSGSYHSHDYHHIKVNVTSKKFLFTKDLLDEEYNVGSDIWVAYRGSTFKGDQTFGQFLRNKESIDHVISSMENSGHADLAPYISQAIEDISKASKDYEKAYHEKAGHVSLLDRIPEYREKLSQLETPIYTVIGNALCDYLEQDPENANNYDPDLNVERLFEQDSHDLFFDKEYGWKISNSKSSELQGLLDSEIINTSGEIINPKAFASSSFLRRYRGLNLTKTPTIKKLVAKQDLANNTVRTNRSAVARTKERLEMHKKNVSQLETPIYRVIGSAILEYISQNPSNTLKLELELNSLVATDKNPLSVDGENPKSERLKGLLADKIIDDQGKIINPQELANSDFLKNYKGYGIDLTKTEAIQKNSKPANNTQNNTNTGERL